MADTYKYISAYFPREMRKHSIHDKMNMYEKKLTIFRNYLVDKVKNNEWTEKEFYKFKNLICRKQLENIVVIEPICHFIFDLDTEEVLSELGSLARKDLISPFLIDSKNTPQDIICKCSLEICQRFGQIANLAIQDFEKDSGYSICNLENYNSVYNSLKDTNSDYYKSYVEAYHNWVDESFENEKFKKFFLDKTELLMEYKTKNILNKIRLYDYKLKFGNERYNAEVIAKRKKSTEH